MNRDAKAQCALFTSMALLTVGWLIALNFDAIWAYLGG